MNTFFKKVRKLQHRHVHELALMCGGVALLVSIVAIAGSGIPRQAHAWTIDISPFTYTPVATGGYTTISWYANPAQVCTLFGPTLPCTAEKGGVSAKSSCSQTVYGRTGSVSTGPIVAPTSYTLSCYSPPGCSWWCYAGYGSASLTVYPTAPAATTLTSFTATPASVASGSRSTLAWSGSKGTNFSACQMTGGQWGAGTWFSALPGSVQTNPLSLTTTYRFNCFDTTGASTGWRSTTVVVTDPVVQDICTDVPGSQASLPGGCTGPTPAPVGACIPSGETFNGSACVPAAICPGANQVGTPPNCTCEVGFQMQGSTCVPVLCPGQNEANWPACTCAPGYSRDAATQICIREPLLDIKVNGLDATRVRKGNSVVVTWDASGVAAGSCRVTTNAGATLGSADSGSVSVVVGNQTTYRLACTNDAGATVSKEANVTLVPSVEEQ